MANGTWERIQGNWKQLTGSVKEQWGQLTDDEIVEAAGEREKFIGQIQAQYGIAREEAEKQVDEWADKIKSNL